MALDTLAKVRAGELPAIPWAKAMSSISSGRWTDAWTGSAAGNNPAPAGTPAPGINGAALTGPLAGALVYPDAAAGEETRLSRFRGLSQLAGSLLLVDRLWHNSGISPTVITAQSITPVAIPARDDTGSTNGEGVFAALEALTAVGAGTPTVTISYTNEAGTAGRTGTNIDPTVASAAARTLIRIGLQAGDKGVRSVQSITLSATWTSGTLGLVLYRPICQIELQSTLNSKTLDAVSCGFPKIFDASVLQFFATANMNAIGEVILSQG